MVAGAKDQAGDVATRLGEAVDSASTSVGRRVDKAGKLIEETGTSAGASVRGAGRYLQNSDAATLREDLRATLARHPAVTLGVGIGAGLLIARLLQPSRR